MPVPLSWTLSEIVSRVGVLISTAMSFRSSEYFTALSKRLRTSVRSSSEFPRTRISSSGAFSRCSSSGFNLCRSRATSAHLAGLQDLLDRSQQAVRVLQHAAIKLAAPGLIHLAAFERLDVQS